MLTYHCHPSISCWYCWKDRTWTGLSSCRPTPYPSQVPGLYRCTWSVAWVDHLQTHCEPAKGSSQSVCVSLESDRWERRKPIEIRECEKVNILQKIWISMSVFIFFHFKHTFLLSLNWNLTARENVKNKEFHFFLINLISLLTYTFLINVKTLTSELPGKLKCKGLHRNTWILFKRKADRKKRRHSRVINSWLLLTDSCFIPLDTIWFWNKMLFLQTPTTTYLRQSIQLLERILFYP